MWEVLIAPTATAAVGITGILVAYLTGQRGRQHAEALARHAHEHSATLLREERTQQRRAEAYVELLTMAERVGQWTGRVRPMYETTPPQPTPPLPELAEQARANALVGAYGSAEVKSRHQEWRDVVLKAIQAVNEINDSLVDRASGAARAEPWRQLDEARAAEREARTALIEQVAAELSGAPIGSGVDDLKV